MKKIILATALLVTLFGISFTVASAFDAKGVVAQAGCDDDSCSD